MDEILEKCPATIGIADDVTVFERTEEEHDRNLHKLMELAAEAAWCSTVRSVE